MRTTTNIKMASSGVFVTTATAVTYKIDNQLTVHYLAFFYLEILNKNFVHKFDKQEGQYLYLVILTFYDTLFQFDR